MDQQQRPRGRGRGRGKDSSGGAGGGPQQARPGPRPAGPSQQGAWAGQQQAQRPVQQPASAWGPRVQVQQQQQLRAPAPQPQNVQAGRATYREGGDTVPPGPGASHGADMVAAGDTTATHGHGAIRGRRRGLDSILRTRPEGLVTKQGNFGTIVKLSANYFTLLHAPDWNLYQYRVDFSPEEDRTNVKKALFREAVKEVLPGYIFDGTVMYTSNRLSPDPYELFVKSQEEVNVRITIRMVGDVTIGDYHRLQVFNIILREAMKKLQLKLLGRNYFDPRGVVKIPEHKLDLWPGYITSIRQHEREILLCSEVTNKVLRTDSVLDLLMECLREDRTNYRKDFQTRIIGSIVLTTYNDRTYRVDDVEWSVNPLSTFSRSDGTSISYFDYYQQRYRVAIRDEQQPLLVSRSKPREIRAGMPETVFLIPELCRMTGLTDAQRANFQLMRALAEHTRVAPPLRIDKLIQFRNRLEREPGSMEVMKRWNLTLDQRLVQFNGRSLPPEQILAGSERKFSAGREADWTRELRSSPMLGVVHLQKWVLICPSRCVQSAQKFVGMLRKAGEGMGWNLAQPKLHEIRDDRPATYMEALSLVSSWGPVLIMCVVTNNKADRYAAIKKKCHCDGSIPTQVILAKNLDSKGAMSIATKVAIQMNCKIGGAPWSVNIPVSGLMVVGYDVCHDTTNKTKSFGAMVASLDRFVTRYFSIAQAHSNGEELSNDFGMNLVMACKTYYDLNKKYPEKIVIYRDGVGDGQLPYVFEHEVGAIKEKLSAIYPNGSLKMAFIVVSKRINTRIFAEGGNNPPPGTVVDDVITLPERYDFFIVSQCVRQGTVSPTSYNILNDTTGLPADHLQRLTYKLTHMYYNWSGTVRVPAPCQYAHKLAFLTGQSLHRQPHKELNTVLHYL